MCREKDQRGSIRDLSRRSLAPLSPHICKVIVSEAEKTKNAFSDDNPRWSYVVSTGQLYLYEDVY